MRYTAMYQMPNGWKALIKETGFKVLQLEQIKVISYKGIQQKLRTTTMMTMMLVKTTPTKRNKFPSFELLGL